uniref:Uncharacterized protein n=1 Tax=Vitis vinifera TaxID=29760 RepID=A5BEW4_VITVI|nr:hypothetical protein VITISV_028019 [Vitis vinifera]
MQDSTSEAPQALAIPLFESGVPYNPPQRRYEMRRPPTTPVASTSCPKRSVRRPPAKKAKVSGLGESSTPPQPQPPATESQFPSGMTLEAIIRRPMRYHLEHLMNPRDFFYSRVALDFYESMTTRHVRNPNVIYFTIDGRHGILGARHIVEALHIPYEPLSPADFREWSHFSQRDMVPYVAPPGAPDMPTPPEPSQDEQPPQAQQAEIPTEIIPPTLAAPSIVPMPKATSSAPPTTSKAPPVVPTTSAPLPSESSITISTSKFRGLCHTLQTLSTTQAIPSEEATPAEQAIPSEEATPVEQTMPHEETTTVEVETPIQSTQETTVEPSSPHDPPTTT